MSHHNHRTISSRDKTKESGRKLHMDWRTWVGVILMLGAMAMYVLSLDDSVVPRLFGR